VDQNTKEFLMKKTAPLKTAFYSDQEILKESGRLWNQWHSELTSKSFEKYSLEEMAQRLVDNYHLDEDCAKAVALNFCQHIGKCDPPTKADLYKVEVSKTFNYPVAEVFNRTVEWLENEQRAQLQNHVNRKRLECKWLSDNSNIGVNFREKGKTKTQVVIKHAELESSSDADIMGNFWREHMTQMIESF